MPYVALLLASILALPIEPLRVVAVVRQGLPPYEDDERLYRLEGHGSVDLRLGATVTLKRPGEKSRPGKLKVMEVHGEYALAALSEEGETYPLKGDLAVPIDPPAPLPALPAPVPAESRPGSASMAVIHPLREAPQEIQAPPLSASIPASVPAPAVHTPGGQASEAKPGTGPAAIPVSVAAVPVSHVQAIYFLKENASLSPGALEKLKKCVAERDPRDQWYLGYPGTAGRIPELQQDRMAALRAELRRLGIEVPEVRVLPPEPAGKYDVIYVLRESR